MPTQNTPFPIPYPPFDPHRCSRAEIRAAQHLKEDYAHLYTALEHAKSDWQAAESAFNHLSDPKAVDVCIYQIQGAQSQYENLLHQLRAVELRFHNLSASRLQNGDADVQVEREKAPKQIGNHQIKGHSVQPIK